MQSKGRQRVCVNYMIPFILKNLENKNKFLVAEKSAVAS